MPIAVGHDDILAKDGKLHAGSTLVTPGIETDSLRIKQGVVTNGFLKADSMGNIYFESVAPGGGVPATRMINTTAPLSGGGDLSADRTIAIADATTAAKGVVELATNGENAANVVVQGNDGRLSDARTPTAHTHPQSDITNLTTDLAAKAPSTRAINTTAPLSGGGDLSADRTIAVADASTTAKGVVELATDGENAANVAVQGNDSRLSDARAPTAHTHPQSDITNLTTDLAAKAPASRAINTSSPLSGGGDLSADRTLSIATPADATKFLNGANPAAYAAVKDSDLSTSDITTNDASTTKHGFAPKLPNDSTKYLDGSGNWSVPPGAGSDWDVEIVKSADQDVENSTTFVDDTEMQFAVTTGEIWYVELFLVYSGNTTTGDYKGNFTFPTSDVTWSYIGTHSNTDALFVQTGTGGKVITTLSTDMQLGTDASFTKRMFRLQMQINLAGTGTLKWRFANLSAGSGRISRTYAGSLLRAKKII